MYRTCLNIPKIRRELPLVTRGATEQMGSKIELTINIIIRMLINSLGEIK